MSNAALLTADALTANELETLKFFNEKAKRLEESLLVKEAKANRIKMNVSWERSKDPSKKHKVTDGSSYNTPDAIEAFVNTFRFFTLRSEATALENMQKLYREMNIRNELKVKFSRLHELFHITLAEWAVIIEQENFNKGDIVENAIFGSISHHNNKRRVETWERWMKDEMNRALANSQFHLTLHQLIPIIVEMKRLNEKILAEYGSLKIRQ